MNEQQQAQQHGGDGGSKDHMELDSVGTSSPRASLRIPRDAMQMPPLETVFSPPRLSLVQAAGENVGTAAADDSEPPATPPHKFSFSAPPPPESSGGPHYDMPQAVSERRPSQFDVPATPLRLYTADLSGGGGGDNRRASLQFEQLRRGSALVYVDKDGLHSLPERTVLVHEEGARQLAPATVQQYLSSSSAAPTPRLSAAPVKRDSGFMPREGAEPFSPASVVSSSGDGHVDRDAMLARAYQDKQSSQVKAWETHRITKNFNKYESEIARISAWEACQVAKAEALMKKSEEEMEKKRAKLREGFKNEIASIHRRADEWKALAETRRVEEILQVQEGAARFRATGQLPKKPLLHIQSLRDMCCAFTLPYKR